MRACTSDLIVAGSSFTPRSSTAWLFTGMPHFTRRRQASAASFVTSRGWLKCVLIQMGPYFSRTAQSSGVMRCGSVTGTREPKRMISRCGISRRRFRSSSMRVVENVSGSPPEMITSRIAGVRRM